MKTILITVLLVLLVLAAVFGAVYATRDQDQPSADYFERLTSSGENA